MGEHVPAPCGYEVSWRLMGVLRCSVAASLFPEPEGVDSCSTRLRMELHLLKLLGAPCSSLNISYSTALSLSLTCFAHLLLSDVLVPGIKFLFRSRTDQSTAAHHVTCAHIKTLRRQQTARMLPEEWAVLEASDTVPAQMEPLLAPHPPHPCNWIACCSPCHPPGCLQPMHTAAQCMPEACAAALQASSSSPRE